MKVKGKEFVRHIPSSCFLTKSTSYFSYIAAMPGKIYHMQLVSVTADPVRDMSDVYTWSFPEFLPFCRHLFDFSSFKAFTKQRPGLV